ncbi:hypothetical protein NML43_18950 [Rhodopseudomonas palustris]|uniref:hypothetical protein n=1 Tax=Rhodopseudomonas palustris TaxID=1076 RepID=UPI0020CE020C|nr:hypothetical protein [Rhodopseudomonas palustris]MCP9629178.1 hypothetical protein [Rhodopseudomonas palustris]
MRSFKSIATLANVRFRAALRSMVGGLAFRKALIAAAIGFLVNQIVDFGALTYFDKRYWQLCVYDCGWYASIVDEWYQLEGVAHEKMDAANWAFFPFFPLSSAIAKFVGRLPTPLALIGTSRLFLLLSIFTFVLFVKAFRPDIPEHRSALVLALNPLSIYGNVGYSESSFFFLSCVGFILLKQRSFVAAGFVGAFLTASRLQGLFFAASYLWRSWPSLNQWSRVPPILLGLMLIPLGLACFMVALYFANGDALAFVHVQRAWNRSIGSPFDHLQQAYYGSARDRAAAILTVCAFCAIGYLVVRGRIELALFSLLSTVVPLSAGIWSMPRFIMWQAPILLVLVELANIRLARYVLYPLMLAGLMFYYYALLLPWDEMI